MLLADLTPLILTFNEAPNIRRTLERLTWAKEILVVDSFSTDETLEIAGSFPQARILQRKFDDHTTQWNFGLDQVRTDWVLSLDADYVLSEPLIDEIKALPEAPSVNAYFARFRYCVGGTVLRATLYPSRAVLFRRSCCRYEKDGHTQALQTNGSVGWLRNEILHDDRKSFSTWLSAQDRYARLEAEKLLNTANDMLNVRDRIRKRILFAPFLVLFYTLFCKGLILDGWPGWYYAFQRTLAELLLSLRLLEKKLTP